MIYHGVKSLRSILIAGMHVVVFGLMIGCNSGEVTQTPASSGPSTVAVPAPSEEYARALRLAKQGRFETAIDEFSRIIRNDPDHVGAFRNRGACRARAGDLNGALADLSFAIQQNPGDVAAFYNRGFVFDELKQYERAIEDYSTAIRLDSDEAKFYASLGLVYKHMNRLSEAIDNYTRAIDVDHRFALAYLLRAEAHEAGAERIKADADRQKAYDIDPSLRQP